jgi:hypothetical protein
MKKSRKNLTNGLSFSIDMNELNLNRRKFDTTEIGRGIGVQKSKKGKGSYTRKNAKFADSSCGYFFIPSYIKRNTCE